MIEIGVSDFLDIMRTKNYEILTDTINRPLSINIIGYRNLKARDNYFDDTISVYWKDYLNQWHCDHFPATTYPGTPWLLKPLNPKGAAVLKPGQYKGVYELGLHRGKYEALVQRGLVTVFRDNDLDEQAESSSYLDTGYFGINIHKASLAARVVGVDSAGCQVLQNGKDFHKLMTLCRLSRSAGWKSFNYTLVEI